MHITFKNIQKSNSCLKMKKEATSNKIILVTENESSFVFFRMRSYQTHMKSPSGSKYPLLNAGRS